MLEAIRPDIGRLLIKRSKNNMNHLQVVIEAIKSHGCIIPLGNIYQMALPNPEKEEMIESQ